MKLFSKLALSREAKLFDSPLFILKGFLSVLTAYVLFSNNPIVGKDMISVLFGMMLSLEPVNISGIKSGLKQFEATIIGCVVTAIIVAVGGINIITVPLAVAVTMYFALKLNWREMPIIAIFTAIYMTQYIQFNAAGDPSVLITLRLRLLALGSGVLIAIVYNFIFSAAFYNSMIRKRTIYIIERFAGYMDRYSKNISMSDQEELLKLKREIPSLFTDIDFVYGHVLDISKEKFKPDRVKSYLEVISEIRDCNHYFFDLLITPLAEEDRVCVQKEIRMIMHIFTDVKDRLEKKMSVVEINAINDIKNENVMKMYNSLIEISSLLNRQSVM